MTGEDHSDKHHDGGDRHITQRELDGLKEYLDEKFKSHRTQMLLYIGIAVGLIRFDVPTVITAGAIAAVTAKGLLAMILKH